MSAPETEAGRALARDLYGSVYQLLTDERTGTPIILAIEREAARIGADAVLTEAIRRVEGLDVGGDGNSYRYVRGETVTVLVDRAAVLSILRDLASRDTGATTGGEGS